MRGHILHSQGLELTVSMHSRTRTLARARDRKASAREAGRHPGRGVAKRRHSRGGQSCLWGESPGTGSHPRSREKPRSQASLPSPPVRPAHRPVWLEPSILHACWMTHLP